MKRISGSAQKCLMHYYEGVSRLDRAEMLAERDLLSEFTGASVHTVRRWNSPDRGMPVGAVYIKLKFFLELLGYGVAELQALPLLFYNLGELLVFTSYEEKGLAEELGYQNSQSVLNLVNGTGNTSESKIEKIQELRAAYDIDIKSNREMWAKRLGVVVVPHEERQKPVSENKKVVLVSDNREEHLLQLGYLVLATVGLAEKVASDAYTAEERKHLREITGGDQVFRLSNAFNKLCGEKARQMIINANGKREIEEGEA